MKIIYLLLISLIFLIPLTTTAQHCTWYWQNPTWGGSGVNDVCFTDENTGWIVSYLGTVLKTTDGGKNFFTRDLKTDASLLGVYFVNAKVGFIFGAGGKFFKTTNGGNDWQEQTNTLGQSLTNASFFDENNGWICGHNGLIAKTTDGGASWTTSVTGTTKILNAIHFYNEDNGIAGGWNNTLIKTSDGGESWVSVAPQGNNLFQSVSFASPDTLYAGGYGIIRSIDGGVSWTPQATPAQFEGVSIKFYNYAKTGVAVASIGTVVRTTDAGEHWNTLLDGISSGNVIRRASYVGETHIFCAGPRSVSGTTFISTTNSSQTWNDYSSTLYCDFISGLYPFASKILFLNKDTGYLIGDNEVYWSSDGGRLWTLSPVNMNTHLRDIAFFDENVGLAVGVENKAIARTSDGGKTWENILQELGGGILSISLPEKRIGYAFGDGEILKTIDGGLNWTKLDFPDVGYIVGYFINKDMGWVAGSGLIKKTTDGGQSWVDLFTGSGIFSSIYFATTDTGWATGSGGVVGRTTDGGLTWDPVHTEHTGTLNGFAFINSREGFVCGSKGFLAYTNDGGINWYKQNIGTKEGVMSVCFIDALTGWITGYGGFIKRTDSGGIVPVVISVEDKNDGIINQGFMLYQNYPNPFNYDTRIRYSLAKAGLVAIKVYDVLGNEVAVLVNEEKSPGEYEVEFSAGAEYSGKTLRLSSGIYFCTLISEGHYYTKKLLLLK